MLPKLVRDGIPQVIREAGKVPKFVHAGPDGSPTLFNIPRELWLRLKFDEEYREFSDSHDPMELVDMYEVLRGMWAHWNPEADISLSEAAAIKRETLGGYDRFTLLTEVKEKEGQ